MLKIGEIVKRFGLSHRTLRYWEEEKILNSERAENGYRYYDDFNVSRIEQIAFLRKLKISIADIERIFKSGEVDMAIDILTRHLYKARQETLELTRLNTVIENIIAQLKSKKDISCLVSASKNSATLQNLLPGNERSISMHTLKTEPDRIVRLSKMTMACYRAESESPETDCWKVIADFIEKNSLHERHGFRHFGFNDPNPSDESSTYGYEMWIAIPEGVEVTAPLHKMEFDGGLYANATTTLSEIGEQSWKLYDWANNNENYLHDTSRRWLEEFPDYKLFWENVNEAKQIDILVPILPK
ncbi:MAG: effector binding domain-containing protein [Oscillospiraceae bacterium]|nr:effector binding domain-containing protein [Oscillospiraceae bacterium]